jgi:hypothetical protein
MVTHSPADAEYSARTVHLFDGQVVSENFIEQEYAAHTAGQAQRSAAARRAGRGEANGGDNGNAGEGGAPVPQ